MFDHSDGADDGHRGVSQSIANCYFDAEMNGLNRACDIAEFMHNNEMLHVIYIYIYREREDIDR